MPELLAVDAGGTSTRSVVVTTEGHCIGYARAGSGNPTAAGPDHAAASVAASATAAIAAAGVPAEKIAGAVLAVAGVSPQIGVRAFSAALKARGIIATPVFESDLLATFFSGTYRDAGYALVAGTGAAAVRVERGSIVATADGLGWLLGDSGSGFYIGHRVARAAMADLDNRGPATDLTRMLLAEFGQEGGRDRGPDGRPTAVSHALDALYAIRPVQLARFARLAFEAPGDEVAESIIRDAANALVHTLNTVVTSGMRGPIVLGGGTLIRHRTLVDRIAAGYAQDGVSSAVRTVADGVVGAAVLALREAGVTADKVVFDRLTASLATVR
ncbi:BadF/BadG/BcrA/BcrD ATPase family protein [Micromonospora sp. WMMD1102]|uniref:N-acetylglucosamine kinase n=1 Tax=Micromonospora sp. WMMD1102 TaxID=3016105 RepID=UPI002414DB2B|nr:BadF/BadG/BcrA/BcrD ATPase family protein [Micromonospora sp. WMMD1102]MDG4791735.1 BadF/BadG/BcrA/BcrD ATPase family protein [Micromonospora sp. WMMD1102]